MIRPEVALCGWRHFTIQELDLAIGEQKSDSAPGLGSDAPNTLFIKGVCFSSLQNKSYIIIYIKIRINNWQNNYVKIGTSRFAHVRFAYVRFASTVDNNRYSYFDKNIKANRNNKNAAQREKVRGLCVRACVCVF